MGLIILYIKDFFLQNDYNCTMLATFYLFTISKISDLDKNA